MFLRSIKGRILAAVVISQLALAAGLVFVGTSYIERRLKSAVDATLRARGMRIATLVHHKDGDPSSPLTFDQKLLPHPFEHDHPDLYQVEVVGKGLLAQSGGWPSDLQRPENKSRWNFDAGGVPYRGILHKARIPSGPGSEDPVMLSILYAIPTEEMNQEVTEAVTQIGYASLAVLALTVAIALWGIHVGLAPLDQLAAGAARVSTHNWDVLPAGSSEQVKELVPLTQAMTTMLGGLREAFTQQREFLANAAHELKTPVAILKSTLQSILQRPRTSEEYRQGMGEALEDLARLEQLLQRMLRLARAEQWALGALHRDLEVVSLADTCEEAISRLNGLAASRGITVQFSCQDPASLRADPEDLQLIWTNLLENAVRYSSEQSTIHVSVERSGRNRAKVTVADSGPGIAEEDITRIFERFHRGDPSRARNTGGFGLGLAIAKALSEAYGGSISASSKVGEGTRMMVELPLAS